MLYFTHFPREGGRARASGSPCSVSLLLEESIFEFIGR